MTEYLSINFDAGQTIENQRVDGKREEYFGYRVYRRMV